MYEEVFTFEESGGQAETPDGKLTWPHMLRIKLDRRHLRHLLMALSQQIDEEQIVEIALSGKLTKEEE